MLASVVDNELLSYRNILDPAWERLIGEQPEATIFHHPAWIGLLSECYRYHPFLMTLCDSYGVIQAGLPFIEINNILTRRYWASLPFTDYCNPLGHTTEARSDLNDRLVRLTNQPGIPDMEVRWDFSAMHSKPCDSPYLLTKICLDPDPDKIFGLIHHSHRRNVRVARKHEVRIESGASLEYILKYYALHVQTRRRQGIPAQPRRFFELLAEKVLRRGLGFVLLAYQGENCLAGAVFLHWGQTLTYKYGASRADGLAMRPNHIIFWNAIQWGCEHGYRIMDLGRTDLGNTGLRDFKKRWGGKETAFFYSYLPVQKRVNFSNRSMHWMKAIIQHSPAWICRLAGEALYKYFA